MLNVLKIIPIFLLFNSCDDRRNDRMFLRSSSLAFYVEVNREASKTSDSYWLPFSKLKYFFESSALPPGCLLYIRKTSEKEGGVLCAQPGSFLIRSGSLNFIFWSEGETSGKWKDGTINLNKWKKIATKKRP